MSIINMLPFSISMDTIESLLKNQDKFFVRTYSSTNTAIPQLADVENATATDSGKWNYTSLAKTFDGSEPWSLKNNYTAWFRQYIFCSDTVTFDTTFAHDDAGNVILNGTSVISASGYATTSSFSMTLNKGWNTLDLLVHEGSGDFCNYLSVNISTLTNVIYAGAEKFDNLLKIITRA